MIKIALINSINTSTATINGNCSQDCETELMCDGCKAEEAEKHQCRGEIEPECPDKTVQIIDMIESKIIYEGSLYKLGSNLTQPRLCECKDCNQISAARFDIMNHI